jgi:hypothetical protein
MTERPLLFTAPMVRAILDGRKTVTRRLKTKAAAGDRLWVRETWSPWADRKTQEYLRDTGDKDAHLPCVYRATVGTCSSLDAGGCETWRSPLFMPRAMSRITLEVLSVRTERLHEITPGEILREGVVLRPHQDPVLGKCPISAFDECCYPDLRSLLAKAWDSINGTKAPYRSNPLVHRIEFRRVTAKAPA